MTMAEAPAETLASSTGLSWPWPLAVIIGAVLVIFSRQPDALLHAQFFAEDGRYWFADAYNHGWWTSLFASKDGYFQTLPRLAAAVALLVPLRFAPLLMNLAGLLVQILPAPLLLSSRFSAWGSLPLRATMAFTYLAMPNCSEMNVTIEEGQWHLALVACLLLLSAPPPTTFWKIFDLKTFVVCGLSGPFAILLLPIAALRLRQRRDPFSRWPLAILLITAALQVFAILSTHRDRWPLGASFGRLIRIVSGQIFLGSIVGSNDLGGRAPWSLLIGAAIAGACAIGYCFFHASAEWKLFLLFAFMLLAASLCRPFTPDLPPGASAWGVLLYSPGIRYWFLPTIGFTWTIVWYLLARPPRRSRQFIGATLMLFMLIGFVRDFRIPPRKDFHFTSYADTFEASPPGTVMTIPINPPDWTMQLVKH